MKITKENLTEYLLTLMLVNAGYEITFDEVCDESMVKSYLDPNYKWYLNYTQTTEQSKKMVYRSCKINKKSL